MYPHLRGRYSEEGKKLVWDSDDTTALPFGKLDLSRFGTGSGYPCKRVFWRGVLSGNLAAPTGFVTFTSSSMLPK